MDPDAPPADQPPSAPSDSDSGPVIRRTVGAQPGSVVEELDSFDPHEPPPLDWRSDSSSDAGSADDLDLEPGSSPSVDQAVAPEKVGDATAAQADMNQQELGQTHSEPVDNAELDGKEEEAEVDEGEEVRAEDEEEEEEEEQEEEEKEEQEEQEEEEEEEETSGHLNNIVPEEDAPKEGYADQDHSRIHSLLNQLQLMGEEAHPNHLSPPEHPAPPGPPGPAPTGPEPCAPEATDDSSSETTGLLFSERHHRDLLGLLQCTEIGAAAATGDVDAVVSVSYSQEDARRYWGRRGNGQRHRDDSLGSLPDDEYPEPVWMKLGEAPAEGGAAAESEHGPTLENSEDRPAYKDVPGPCDPDDLLDGVIFGAKYLGSTQIKSERNPSTNARMTQAQEAVDRIKAPEGESQPMTEVDLFISTQRIKVLTADTQEAMMDHGLQMISYIADINDIVVLMARRKRRGPEGGDSSPASTAVGPQNKCLMICHVFSSEDAQTIAQAIGQAFGVAYQQFLQSNGIKASDLKPGEYSDFLGSQELYNGDLAHFSDSQNLKDVAITKAAGEILGVAVVESGWGSILPTVVVANLLHGGAAERSGELSIGDRIMSVNGTSMVGLPIATCQSVIRDLKSQKYVKLSIVRCPPVTLAIIRRPDPKFQLGFSVEDGIICSLMRGGIAERGGIRVGHRIIEINGQSVVATPHEKIIQILTSAVGEIHLKTMPASTYRLLTGQEQPVFL